MVYRFPTTAAARCLRLGKLPEIDTENDIFAASGSTNLRPSEPPRVAPSGLLLQVTERTKRKPPGS